MVTIPFGEFTPDLPDFANPGSTIASGVQPFFTSYKPQPNLGTAMSTALTGRAQGAFSVTDTVEGASQTFVADATKLYIVRDGSVTDVSKSGGYTVSVDESVEFVAFNNKCVAASIENPLQVYPLNNSVTLFADLATSTLRPKARHIGVVNQFIVLGNVDEGGTKYPNRLRWSALNDELDYDQSAATQSDLQDIEGDIGRSQRVVGGGEYGVIFSQNAIHRIEYIGSPEIFQITWVEQNRGTIAPGSVVPWGRLTYFLSDDGFFVFDGSVTRPISHGKVSKWLFDNLSSADFFYRITGAVDAKNSLIYWTVITTNATGAFPNCDRIVLYHWPSGRWAYSDITTEMVFTGLESLSLEDLDGFSTSIDTLTLSLDSQAFLGGKSRITAFDGSSTMKAFDGANIAATLETGEVQLVPGRRAVCNGFTPLVDGGTLTGAVGSVERLNNALTFDSANAQETTGHIPALNSGRFHKFRTSIAASGTWTHAQGVIPDAVDGGVF